jgi:SRSO17 transposase
MAVGRRAAHPSRLAYVGTSTWSNETMRGKVKDLAAANEASGGVEALIVDDTDYQKQDLHSAGVAPPMLRAIGQDRKL